MRFLSLFAVAAPLVAAIEFTSPAANSTLTKGSTYDLTWTSVDTDPEKFSIYLVNFVDWPPFYEPVVRIFCPTLHDTKADHGHRPMTSKRAPELRRSAFRVTLQTRTDSSSTPSMAQMVPATTSFKSTCPF